MSLGMNCNPSALLPDASGEIVQQLEILRQRTQDTSEDLRRMEQEQEAFALEYHELTKIQANLTHLQNQAPSQQRNDFEKQLRIKKDMSEHKLNVKVVKKSQVPTINDIWLILINLSKKKRNKVVNAIKSYLVL